MINQDPINKLESVLKLTSKLSTNNMVLHDRDGKLQKFRNSKRYY